MTDFKTRAVKDIVIRNAHGTITSPHLAAFAELPEGVAMLVPFDGQEAATKRGSLISQCIHRFGKERRIHSVIDREEGGVWLWWEPRA